MEAESGPGVVSEGPSWWSRLSRLAIRPLGLASAFLLLGAILLPWVSLVTVAIIRGLAFPVFGAQASLWDLAGYASPVALYHAAPLAAGILLAGALPTVLMRPRLGATLAAVAVLVFIGGTWGLFGSHSVGSALTVIAPGPGIEWAVAGLLAAAGSFRSAPRTARDLFRGLRTPAALAEMGLFLAGLFLAIDAAYHASGGNLLAVLGDGDLEPWLHGLFIGSVGGLVTVRLLRPRGFGTRTGSVLIGFAALGLLADAALHVLSGDLSELVGHTPAEALAHLATYYGIALLAVARFVLRADGRTVPSSASRALQAAKP